LTIQTQPKMKLPAASGWRIWKS